jgi:hypothetical protein
MGFVKYYIYDSSLAKAHDDLKQTQINNDWKMFKKFLYYSDNVRTLNEAHTGHS